MELLAHRGLWEHRCEMNSRQALFGALLSGLGLETDVRDFGSSLRIAHDPAQSEDMLFEELLEFYACHDCTSTLAINIKADGLAQSIRGAIERYRVENYFCFDMSIPDHRHYVQLEMETYARQSELEQASQLSDYCSGVWLDGFDSDWFCDEPKYLAALLKKFDSVCIVSSELHGRDHQELWRYLQTLPSEITENLQLCTDFPRRYGELKCA